MVMQMHVAKTFDRGLTGAALVAITDNAFLWSDPTVAFTGMTSLNLMNQGADVNQRVGSVISMKSIEIDAIFTYATAPNANTAFVRFLMLYDRQPNKAQVAKADILNECGTAGTVSFFAQRNVLTRTRFTTLFDRVYHLDNVSVPTRVVHIYKKLNGLRTEFSGNSGTMSYGDITTGALLVMAFGLPGYGNTFPTLQTMHSRLRYFD